MVITVNIEALIGTDLKAFFGVVTGRLRSLLGIHTKKQRKGKVISK
jgi:hypothetical protein